MIANAHPTSADVDGYYRVQDPVLRSPFTSFQTKADITTEVNTSSRFLNLGRNYELVFHRDTVEDQVKVIRKALAYVELIITNNCRYNKVTDGQKGARVNHVKAYLDKRTMAEVNVFRDDTNHALEDMDDTNSSMAVYRMRWR
jgi:hypothetical protein